MIIKFKNYPLSNDLSIFSRYKRLRGSSLERDQALLERREAILKSPTASAEEREQAIESIDPLDILTGLYYAMRCAAERRELDIDIINSEIGVDDITDPAFTDTINKLVGAKKKQTSYLGRFQK